MARVFKDNHLRSLVEANVEAWQAGQRPDAAAVLAAHPELHNDKSLALDLIYEELRLRSSAGDTLVQSTFCERFPAYRQSVAKMFEVNEFTDQCPQLPPREADWPLPGGRFRGYDIVQMLGRGALGRVYLAREPALGQRLVVIKVSWFGASEAETIGRLAHDNIVPIHSVQHDGASGWTVICMPLVGTATGVDLLEAAAAGARAKNDGAVVARVGRSARPVGGAQLPPATSRESRQWRGTYPDAVARLGWQLAEGLQAAHAQGVAHRDLKPSNVLLAWSGRPMLLDFNLATDDNAENSRVGGTLAYMAPEQIAVLAGDRAAARKFEPHGDIYSLGVVLYELLTGRLPASPENADELPADAYAEWLASKSQPPPPIRRLAPHVDPQLAAIVHKCLTRAVAERYATAAELAADLRAYLSPAPAARRYAQRHWRWLTTSLVAALAICAVAAAYIGTLPSREQQLLDKAHLQYGRGQFPEAVQTATQGLDLNQRSRDLLFLRAQAQRLLKHYAEARADYVRLTEFDEGAALAMAGVCDVAKNDPQTARDELLRAQIAGVHHPTIAMYHCQARRKSNDHATAIHLYIQAIKANPDNYLAYRGRASSYMSLATSTVAGGNDVLDNAAIDDVMQLMRLHPRSLETLKYALVVLNREAREKPANRDERLPPLARATLLKGLSALSRDQLTKPPYQELVVYLPDENADVPALEWDPAPEPTIDDLPLPNTSHWQEFVQQMHQPDR